MIDSTDPHPRAMDIDSGSTPSSPRAGVRPMGYLSPEQLVQSPASKAGMAFCYGGVWRSKQEGLPAVQCLGAGCAR